MPVMETDRAPEESGAAGIGDGAPGASPSSVPPPAAPVPASAHAPGPAPASFGAVASLEIAPPTRSDGWQPLAGQALLERLRVTGRPRPPADPELALRFRRVVEEGLASRWTGEPSDGPPPLVVTKDRLTRVLACERHQAVSEFGEREPTAALACGALIDVLFRQLVTVGTIGDPMEDGLEGLRLDDRQRELATWIDRMEATGREELRVEVERQVAGLRQRWPTLSPAWLPRTQETMRVGLLDGAVALVARVDLVLGGAALDEASVALVEIKSGARRVEHRAELHFYALVETLRSLAPPFVVATYYTRTGELDTEPVTPELLSAAARRTLTGARALLELAGGREPRPTPNGLCGRCAALPDCDVGRDRVERRAEDGEPGRGAGVEVTWAGRSGGGRPRGSWAERSGGVIRG